MIRAWGESLTWVKIRVPHQAFGAVRTWHGKATSWRAATRQNRGWCYQARQTWGRRNFGMTEPPPGSQNMHVEQIERLEAENARLRAAIEEAQEAIEQHKIKGPGSVDFDGILARLRDALGRRL